MFFNQRREAFTAYIVFHGAEHQIWWRMFTKAGYRHAMLIIPTDGGRSLFDPRGSCVVVNGLSYTVNVNGLETTAKQAADHCLANGATEVLRFKVSKKFTREFVPRGILTCVSLIKAIIGINAWWVITPEQLRKWLLENGAEKV